MTSQDVVAPALLLPIPLLSILLSLYNVFFHRSTPAKRATLILLAVLAAVAGGTAISAACGQPLRIVAKVFTALLHATLSAISIYALGPSSHTPTAFPPPFLAFFLSLAALLVACELISSLIPTSPLLLSAMLALVSRTILLSLAMATAILLYRRRADVATESSIEKGSPVDDSPAKTPGRVSSPTQATWPFPGSLAATTHTHHVARDASKFDSQYFIPILFPLLVMAQIFATFVASLSVAVCIRVDAAINQPPAHILIASAICTLLWSLAVLAVIQILPTHLSPCHLETRAAVGYRQGPPGGDSGGFSHGNNLLRTPKPSFSRRESDSLLDFLSLRDPFASSPPPPPPLPPIGLGLDEADVGWNGNKGISVQYRFPAPRSIVKGGRRQGKHARAMGKKRLAPQDSSRTLLPVPESRGAETDLERDRGFGDEARLAQLLLQSLCDGEDALSPSAPIPVPTVQSPQPVHVQPCSRWSASTTVPSVMSGSISNRSGVSTYTTCASERVPPSRISMNTISSVLGSRKGSETRRKSAMTASSSKG